jgi:hypothetical protein
MNDVTGLRVLVQGDLPADVMRRVGAAVRAAALAELAEIDIAPALFEVPWPAPSKPGPDVDLDGVEVAELGLPIVPELLGLWLKTSGGAGFDPGVGLR